MKILDISNKRSNAFPSSIFFICIVFRQIFITFFRFFNLKYFRVLRENGKYLSKQAFFMRKNYFNDEETGVLKVN